MKELEENVCVCVCVCVCVKFCCKLSKNFTEMFQLLNQAYREDCMSLDLDKKRMDESVKDQGVVGCVF